MTSNRQTTIHTRTQSYGQLRLPNSPHVHVIGLWQENLGRTHADTRRTCRLHTERDQSYDFVAVRRQAHHCTAVSNSSKCLFFQIVRQTGSRVGGSECVSQTYVLQLAIFKRPQIRGFNKATLKVHRVSLYFTVGAEFSHNYSTKTQFRYIQCFSKQTSC